MTEIDIRRLNCYAKRILGSRHDIQPEDIVQEAVVKGIEAGSELTFETILPFVKDRAYRTIRYEQCRKNSPNDFTIHQTTKFCKDCNEDIPIACFYIFQYSNGVKKLSNWCKKHWKKRIHQMYYPYRWKKFKYGERKKKKLRKSDIMLIQMIADEKTRNEIALKMKVTKRQVDTRIEVIGDWFGVKHTHSLVYILAQQKLIV